MNLKSIPSVDIVVSSVSLLGQNNNYVTLYYGTIVCIDTDTQNDNCKHYAGYVYVCQ